MPKSMKTATLAFNPHRNEWELWYQSEVVIHGTDHDAIRRWAEGRGYDVAESSSES